MFCTAINCMDGRTQEPVIAFLKQRLGVDYVDMVTAPGAVGVLIQHASSVATDSLLRAVEISAQAHDAKAVAVVAHALCAGNPIPDDEQKSQVRSARTALKERFPKHEVLGLWVSDEWKVEELD